MQAETREWLSRVLPRRQERAELPLTPWPSQIATWHRCRAGPVVTFRQAGQSTSQAAIPFIPNRTTRNNSYARQQFKESPTRHPAQNILAGSKSQSPISSIGALSCLTCPAPAQRCLVLPWRCARSSSWTPQQPPTCPILGPGHCPSCPLVFVPPTALAGRTSSFPAVPQAAATHCRSLPPLARSPTVPLLSVCPPTA